MTNFRCTQPLLAVALVVVLFFAIQLKALAAPPLRIAIIPGGGSGIEQEVVDRITSQLQDRQDVVISTVNPDWYVVCNITERLDQVSGAIRYNGNVTVKTKEGHVISTTAVQKYNQDFSLQPGVPLNKALVDGAAREAINGIVGRAVGPIQNAVDIEMQMRDKVISASQFANADNYDDALSILQQIGPETPSFESVRKLGEQFAMEKEAMRLYNDAQVKVKAGKYGEAIGELKQVSSKSKRYSLAKQKIVAYQLAMKPKSRIVSKNTTTTITTTTTTSTTSVSPNARATKKQEKEAIMSEVAGSSR